MVKRMVFNGVGGVMGQVDNKGTPLDAKRVAIRTVTVPTYTQIRTIQKFLNLYMFLIINDLILVFLISQKFLQQKN